MQNGPPHILFRKPVVSDAQAIWKLIRTSPPLDLNSLYCYLILCVHFSDTSVVAESSDGLCGYISAYIRPDQPDTIFVWQVVVAGSHRGRGIAKSMLHQILNRTYRLPISYLETTVNPSNRASDALFVSFAAAVDTPCTKHDFFSKNDFGESFHEDEILYRIGPFDAHPEGGKTK